MCRRPRETQCCAHVLQVCYVGLVGSVSFWHTVKAQDLERVPWDNFRKDKFGPT